MKQTIIIEGIIIFILVVYQCKLKREKLTMNLSYNKIAKIGLTAEIAACIGLFYFNYFMSQGLAIKITAYILLALIGVVIIWAFTHSIAQIDPDCAYYSAKDWIVIISFIMGINIIISMSQDVDIQHYIGLVILFGVCLIAYKSTKKLILQLDQYILKTVAYGVNTAGEFCLFAFKHGDILISMNIGLGLVVLSYFASRVTEILIS